MHHACSITALLLGALVATTARCEPITAITTDPAADPANPASLVEITVPSHGVQLLGALYMPTGTGTHPAAIIFHGFPGYEQNLDLAQTLRRAGYDVLAVHYRGSWGIPGTFSYAHAIEDADAEVDWLSSPQVSAKYQIDTTRIVVIGHSMGGYMALSAAAHNRSVFAAVSISGVPPGHPFAGLKAVERQEAVAEYVANSNPVDFLPLAGTSAKELGKEKFDHRDEWDFLKLAPALGKRPVLLITANDKTGPSSAALLKSLEAAGATRSRQIEISTDHPFSDHRIALEEDILNWLEPLTSLSKDEAVR